MVIDQRYVMKDRAILTQCQHQSVHMPICLMKVLGLGSSACKQCGYCSSFRPSGVGGNPNMCVCGHYSDYHYR